VAAVLLWLAFRQTDAASLAAAARGAAWPWLLAALGLVLVDRSLMAWRWITLLRAIEPGADLRLGQVMRIFFVSTFVGTFLPGGGGDAVRAMSLARLHVPAADAVASVVVDRLLGVISMLAMGVAGLVFAGRLVETRVLVAATAVSVLVTIAALLLLFDSRILTGLVRLAAGGRFPRLERLAGKFLAGIRQYGRHRGVLVVVLGASLGIQILRTLQAWCLGLSIGLATGGVWYFAFVPIITLIMQLPLTPIAGLGTANVAFQFFLALAGVDPAEALVLSILYLGLGWIGNLPGGVLFMVDPASRPRPAWPPPR
jgi:hypothetical protein